MLIAVGYLMALCFAVAPLAGLATRGLPVFEQAWGSAGAAASRGRQRKEMSGTGAGHGSLCIGPESFVPGPALPALGSELS